MRMTMMMTHRAQTLPRRRARKRKMKSLTARRKEPLQKLVLRLKQLQRP
jgi:hypothetical protein